MDRGSVFSDPQIIARLKSEFIPVVGNTHEIQNGRSRARDWFMGMAALVNPRVKDNVTAQGFYVAGPDGTPYGFNNNRSVERVSRLMDNALKDWRAKPPRPIEIGAEELATPYAPKLPDGGLSARVFARISPLPPGCGELNKAPAQDHMWIYPAESAAIASAKPGADGSIQLPATLVTRIVRFHLVDNVRGEPDFWGPAEIVRSDFVARRSRSDGPVLFSASYSMRTSDGGRGMEGRLEGRFDIASGKVSSFKAYGEAQAWGAGTYTPDPPPGRFPIKFAFLTVSDAVSKAVPPQGIISGEYERPSTK